eukprot:TRINITY_DN2829_c0_g1_i1.p1 TRINITY_DN2829_c0_g1~~TRINITY_DN2829_c0_g1_i1.p1  ORF type:complete len:592 (-),score=152.77 TRINITY_DN2829_c0_g1_i1:157-1932(-)
MDQRKDKLRKLMNSSEIEKMRYEDIKLKTKYGFTSNKNNPIKIESNNDNKKSYPEISTTPPIESQLTKPRRRSSSFVEKGLDHFTIDHASRDDLTFSFKIRSKKINGQLLYVIEQMNLAHTHAPIQKMELTVDQLIAFQLYIADTIDDPRSAPELPSELLQDDIMYKDLNDNNILLKQFLDEVFYICDKDILEKFNVNKKAILEDVSQFKQTVHTKIAKKEEELDKLDGELYMKLRRKRSFKLYKVRKIGYQLYYFNSKRIKNTGDTQLASGFILLDHIIDVMDEIPNKKKKYPELEKMSPKMSNFFVSTYSVNKKVAKIFKFACPSHKLKFWKNFFFFCSHKYATVDALRQNNDLIAGYTQYLLSRTPVFDWVKILPALEKLDLWFVTLANDRKQMSSKLDISILTLAISIIIGTHHHKLILQIMKTLYNTIQIFTEPQRDKLLEFFFQESVFFNFFLSWNLDVRTYFQFLLCFKVLKIREAVISPFVLQKKKDPKLVEFTNVPPLVAPYIQVDVKYYLLLQQRMQEIMDNSPSVQTFPPNYRDQSLNQWNKLRRMYKDEYEGQTISPLVRKFPVLRPPVLIQFNPMHQY